jgi:hypothetical protein
MPARPGAEHVSKHVEASQAISSPEVKTGNWLVRANRWAILVGGGRQVFSQLVCYHSDPRPGR